MNIIYIYFILSNIIVDSDTLKMNKLYIIHNTLFQYI